MTSSTLTPQKKTKKLNSTLVSVIIISGLFHVILALVLGGITIVEYILVDEANFEAPDTTVIEEPPPVKVTIQVAPPKVDIQPLKLRAISQIAVSDIDVNLPSMGESFTTSAGIGSVGGGQLSLGNLGSSIARRFPDIKGFGTTNKTSYAWEGSVHLFKPKGISRLLDEEGKKVTGLRSGRRQGGKIYNYTLNLPAQSFDKGFPGVTDQFEWFAIDFETTLFWPPELTGEYEFRLQSDDGSVLIINRDIVVNNDSTHGMETKTGKYTFKTGNQKLRLLYFQGPATGIGLILEYRKSGERAWKLFDIRELIKYQTD